ncbi:hypothetical protein GCM10009642_12540 [Nocardiopsis metallicus]
MRPKRWTRARGRRMPAAARRRASPVMAVVAVAGSVVRGLWVPVVAAWAVRRVVQAAMVR